MKHRAASYVGILLAVSVVALFFLVGTATAGGADWDSDDWEFEAPQQRAFDEKAAANDAADAAAAKAEAYKRRAEKLNAVRMAHPPLFEWKYEGVAIALIVIYVVNYVVGNAANKKLAKDWEAAFCTSDGVFAKNFSVMGADGAGPSKNSLLAREGPDEYTFYASGRRFVEGVMVKLKLRARNDLFSTLYNMAYRTGEPDLCIVECFMKDECVSQGSVFAIGDRARIATLENTAEDVKRLTSVYVPKDAKGRNATSSSIVVRRVFFFFFFFPSPTNYPRVTTVPYLYLLSSNHPPQNKYWYDDKLLYLYNKPKKTGQG